MISDGFVVIIPSASVLFFRYSTAISRGLNPPTRSTCTMAILPAALIFFTMSPIEQISPNKIKTTRMSSSLQHCSKIIHTFYCCNDRILLNSIPKFPVPFPALSPVINPLSTTTWYSICSNISYPFLINKQKQVRIL